MYQDGSFAEGYAIGRDSGNSNSNGMFGNDGWWGIILLALLFGWGNNGYGNFGGNGGSGIAGYEMGKLATQSDVASGFSTSATLNSLNDLKLGQSSLQQTLCQGFSGVNSAIANSGYETRFAINDLGYRLQDCCCATQNAIQGVNYNIAQSTCALQNTMNNNTRDIIDSQRETKDAILGYLTSEKISSLQQQNAILTSQLSQNAQTRTLIDALMPTAKPAYITCSPYQSAFGNPFNNGCNGGCGCC